LFLPEFMIQRNTEGNAAVHESGEVTLSLEEKRKKSLEAEWESLCAPETGCRTQCCYFEGEPCEHLDIYKPSINAGRCRIYENRFGIRNTTGGKTFRCAPMWERLLHLKAPARCGYEGIKSVNGQVTKGFTV